MPQTQFLSHNPSRRERTIGYCNTCKTSTDHLKEAGQADFKCVPCEERRKKLAAQQQAGGI